MYASGLLQGMCMCPSQYHNHWEGVLADTVKQTGSLTGEVSRHIHIEENGQSQHNPLILHVPEGDTSKQHSQYTARA